MSRPGTLRVAMVGHAFMGAAHSRAWRDINHVYRLPVRAELALLCGRDADRTAAAAAQQGWQQSTTDWREAVERPDIDVLDICTPVSSHAEIAVAALRAGKHVLCEKPLALDRAQAEAMVEAAAGAGVVTMCGFNYRRLPAIALFRKLVLDGRLGAVRQARVSYRQDWGVLDESMSWRFSAAEAGYGALGDLGSHAVDLAEFVTGTTVRSVSGAERTYVPERLAVDGTSQPVDVDDATTFLALLDDRALATFEVTRVALGAKNELVVEVFGERGSLGFDLQRLNELRYFDVADAPTTAGYRTVMVTEPEHPYLDAWWPPGHVLGWEHTFIHEVRDFVQAVASGQPAQPDFAQGAHVQAVLDSVSLSATTRCWQDVPA